MSPQPPPVAEAVQSISQIEFLWERYRRWVWVLVAAVFCGLGVNYAVKYQNQRAIDAEWSGLVSALALDTSYSGETQPSVFLERVESLDLDKLEGFAASADPVQQPYVLMAVARRAIALKDWDRAEKALGQIEAKFPKHPLVTESSHPVQFQDEVKDDEEKPPSQARKVPELKPAKAGSAVGLMRRQVASARSFAMPAQFGQKPVPPDAKKVEIEFGTYGSVTIALMSAEAPKHCEAFLKHAEAKLWEGMNVDEIRRPREGMDYPPRSMHLGFASTKESSRDKWTTTEPSTNILDFEHNSLSHFPGAVAARIEGGEKSCSDRFWIVADDSSSDDGSRVIFGYVVNGLDVVKKICEASLSAQDEQSGVGKPTENVTVTKVTVL